MTSNFTHGFLRSLNLYSLKKKVKILNYGRKILEFSAGKILFFHLLRYWHKIFYSGVFGVAKLKFANKKVKILNHARKIVKFSAGKILFSYLLRYWLQIFYSGVFGVTKLEFVKKK